MAVKLPVLVLLLLLLLRCEQALQPATAAAALTPTWQVNECEVHRGARHLHNHHIPAELEPTVLTSLSSPQSHARIPCCC
jgi:hypothetical protein